MGLMLDLPTPQGGSANYHKVIIQDLAAGRIFVASYLSHGARVAGNAMVMGKAYFFPNDFTEEALAVTGITPMRLAYNLLKSQEDFAGSVDLV